MRIVPTWSAFWKTLFLALFVASIVVNVIAIWGWALAEEKWKEVIDTAKFNDLDGDGVSNVIIKYK